MEEKIFTNKKIIITAGGTREKIDPVRFIGNRSSGKMGFALAEASLKEGADVVLITTVNMPTLKPELDSSKLKVIKLESAAEMKQAVEDEFIDADALIMAAAVADYAPKQSYEHKIKKDLSSETLTIELEKTVDILKEISKLKKTKQVILGFAVETQNLMENAERKLHEKKLDMIAVNNIDAFEEEDSQLTLLLSDELHDLGVAPKFTRMLKQSKAKSAEVLCYHIGLILKARALQAA